MIFQLKTKSIFFFLALGWTNILLALTCPTGEYKVRTHPRTAYYRADGTFVSASQVKEYCKEKGAYHEIWSALLNNKFPVGWPNKDEKLAGWTEEHRERVLEALNELPEELLKIPLKGIYRLHKSIHGTNPASHGNELIVLYDSAFSESRRLARILAHELAHRSYARMSGATASSYRRTVGWTEVELQGDTIVWKERSGSFVEEDGQIGPDEDYANNLEYFLFEPEVLKSKTPKAFEWMKNQYGDKFKIRKGAK